MEKLFANTWSVFDEMVRVFVLAGEERALVIDSGVTGIDIHEMVRRCTDLPYRLLNTHADRDHIAGNGQFAEVYMHPAEIAFYRNSQHGTGSILPVFDGDVIDLGGRSIEIIHLPGHTPGSITVLDREQRCLIGGDPIQEDWEIYMFGLQRSMEAYIASLERLLDRADFDWIYPSHGNPRVSRDVIPALISGAGRLLAGDICGTEKIVNGQSVLSCDAGVARFLVDFSL